MSVEESGVVGKYGAIRNLCDRFYLLLAGAAPQLKLAVIRGGLLARFSATREQQILLARRQSLCLAELRRLAPGQVDSNS